MSHTVNECKGFLVIPGDVYASQRYKLLKNLPPEFFHLMKNNEGYICGGALNSVFSGREINDYDLYFMSKDKAEYEAKKIKEPNITTNNALTYIFDSCKIQINKRNFGTCEDVLNGFDFTVVQAGYSPGLDRFIFHKQFLSDLSIKTLRYNHTEHESPINSLLRVLKYQKRGYHITGLEMVKLALNINKKPITTRGELFSELNGCSSPNGLEGFFTDEMKKESSEYDYKTFLKEVIERETVLYEVVSALKSQEVDVIEDLPF